MATRKGNSQAVADVPAVELDYITVEDIEREIAAFTITRKGKTLQGHYRPNAMTPALDADLQTLTTNPERARIFTEAMSALLMDWSLTQDGRPYPTDPDSLRRLGYPTLWWVMNGIMDAFQAEGD